MKTYQKHIITSLLVLSWVFPLRSQIEITYKYIQNLNGIPLPRTATLVSTPLFSYYSHSKGDGFVTIDYFGHEGDINAQVVSVNNSIPEGQIFMDGYMKDTFGNVIFIDKKLKVMKVRELIILKSVVYQEPTIPKFVWKYLQVKEKIGDWLCNTASTSFRGRSYKVWYSTKLPGNIGPWKFSGLPGTILKVEEANGALSLLAEKINLHPTINPGLKTESFNWTGEVVPFKNMKSKHEEITADLQRTHGGNDIKSEDLKTKPVKMNFLETF